MVSLTDVSVGTRGEVFQKWKEATPLSAAMKGPEEAPDERFNTE